MDEKLLGTNVSDRRIGFCLVCGEVGAVAIEIGGTLIISTNYQNITGAEHPNALRSIDVDHGNGQAHCRAEDLGLLEIHQTAQLSGSHDQTIYKAIQRKRLSATTLPFTGNRQFIDPIDLPHYWLTAKAGRPKGPRSKPYQYKKKEPEAAIANK